ncbi:MAG: hypothetical protein M0Z94_07605, partial [Dehalococcoidales bacterium]|nr:hypothetical protein [Dehalococcoidales bacterium]
FTTGLVLQELLQGFSGPKARDALIERFAALALLQPDRGDHIDAADLRNRCRRVQWDDLPSQWQEAFATYWGVDPD